MSADIGPGDWVECFKSMDPNSTRVGKIFQCERVWPASRCTIDHGPCGGIILVGDNTPPHGWALCNFRPIYRPKPNAFDQYLKAPNKQKEDA